MGVIIQPNVMQNYLVQPDVNGRHKPISGLELSCIMNDPQYIGKVVSKSIQDTYISYLLATGSEIVKPGEQFFWKEEGTNLAQLDYTGPGLVTRAGDTFTLNPSALPASAVPNFDKCAIKPSDLAWGLTVKQEVLIVDSTGKEETGIVTAVSADKKQVTILSKESPAWALDTKDLDVISLASNLDNCECPPCIGFAYKDNSYSNTFVRDGGCVKYCEDDLIANTGNVWQQFTHDDNIYSLDRKLDDKQKEMWRKYDKMIMFAEKTKAGSAAANANIAGEGMSGIAEQVQQRGYGWQGFIESEADLVAINDLLRRRHAPDEYVIHANSTQYTKLQNMLKVGTIQEYDPFAYNSDITKYLGFKAINIQGRTLEFQRWDALDNINTSANLSNSYNFMLTPNSTTRVNYSDGSSEDVGYVSLVWNGKDGNVLKMKRYSNENSGNCGNVEVKYINKFSVMVAKADHFMLGKKGF